MGTPKGWVAVSRIRVEPSTGLAAQPARLHVLAKERAGPELRIAQVLVEDLTNGQDGIEADTVGQGQRTFRMVYAIGHRQVDGLGGQRDGLSLLQKKDGLV